MKTSRILPVLSLLLSIGCQAQPRSAEQVIEIIIQKTGSPVLKQTVDVIKEGDPRTPVTGIVTCMFATMDVLRQAVAQKCNLVVAHEPVFYDRFDDTRNLQTNQVYLEKRKYILDHGLVVWRFHDYIHRIQPDAVLSGVIEKLGWKKMVVNAGLDELVFPGTPLKDILKDLKKTFPQTTFNVVGNPDFKVTHVRLAPGAAGSGYHISLLERADVDLVIAGEAQQWETYEYARDAVDQGRNKAVIFLGHIPSEEPGMDFCAGWLRGFIKDIPIHFVESKSSYWAY